MIARFVEVTNQLAYGKFIVARLDPSELQMETMMPDALPGTRLLTYAGRRRYNDHTTLVIDYTARRRCGVAAQRSGVQCGALSTGASAWS